MISLETVISVKIEPCCDSCLETAPIPPCAHRCHIVLKDGRKKSVNLRGEYLQRFLTEIPNHKIFDESHVKEKKFYTFTSLRSEEILQRIFQENLAFSRSYLYTRD